jgi:hypothetical protein
MITTIVRLGKHIKSQPDIMGNREYDGNRMGNITGIQVGDILTGNMLWV